MAHPDRYLLFIEYFNSAKFDSAQSILGEVWLAESGKPDKDFYGGLIQVSVALYHLMNDDVKFAVRTYENGRDMLVKFGDIHHGIVLQKLLVDLQDLFATHVREEDRDIDYRKLIPRIEFQETT